MIKSKTTVNIRGPSCGSTSAPGEDEVRTVADEKLEEGRVNVHGFLIVSSEVDKQSADFLSNHRRHSSPSRAWNHPPAWPHAGRCQDDSFIHGVGRIMHGQE